jgi:Autographiviridae endonuclease VII
MPYKDEEKRRAYDKERDRRAYDKERYHNNPDRKVAVKAAARRRWFNLTPEERKKWYGNRTPLSRRKEHLKGRYGLTLEQWEAMFNAQGRRCAICGSVDSGWSRAWHTDHDHETNQVRAILCHRCNRTLGQLNEDPLLFQAFIDYLTQNKLRLRLQASCS